MELSSNQLHDGFFMAGRIVLSLLLCQCLAMPVCARADNYEITAISGYRFSDSLQDETSGTSLELDETSSFGFIVSSRRDSVSYYDFLFSRQDTVLRHSAGSTPLNVRLDYYQVGGTVYYEDRNLFPFATGGLGFTHITSGDPTLSPETHLSLSVGGGLRIPLSDRIGLRMEARLSGILLDANGSILCANGSCTASLNGDMYMQFETSIGLAVAF